MKLLWICNLVFPSVAEKLNIPVSFAGGWLIGASSELKKMRIIIYIYCRVHNMLRKQLKWILMEFIIL